VEYFGKLLHCGIECRDILYSLDRFSLLGADTNDNPFCDNCIIAPPEDKLQFSCIGAAGLHYPNPKHDALKSAHESNQ
jgi:hypothetical protein